MNGVDFGGNCTLGKRTVNNTTDNSLLTVFFGLFLAISGDY